MNAFGQTSSLLTAPTDGVDAGVAFSAHGRFGSASGLEDPLSQSLSYGGRSSFSSLDNLAVAGVGLSGTSIVPSLAASTSLDPAWLNPTEQWTVMVYMASDNLESFGIQDFLEMANIGSNPNVNVVVQFDRTAGVDASYGDWTDTRRGLVEYGDTPDLNWGTSIGEANMGDAGTLSEFVNWGMSNYQAENYALVLWGHGSGFNTPYDDGDALTASELTTALDTVPLNLDVLAADACLMATTEFAYEVSDHASVFVGSQELVPGEGYNYTSWLSSLSANPYMSDIDLGNTLVNSYANHYSAVDSGIAETLSAIDLSGMQFLTTAIDQFASTVMSSAGSYDLYVLDYFRDYYSNTFGDGSFPDYVDLGNVFSSFVSYATAAPDYITDAVADAAQAVLDSYNSVVLNEWSSNPTGGTGLSLYFSDKGVYPTSSYNANELSFAADTQWDEFLNWAGW